jgi:hypothetical protein
VVRNRFLYAIWLLVALIAIPALAEDSTDESPAPRKSLQIERGAPRPIIDGIGWLVGIPGKIVLWNRRVDNHNVSENCEAQIAQYITIHELEDTKVRINEYAPLDEWRRLRDNKSVGAGWRYTVGAISTLGYTVFPGRIFGGDHYNPYTNTLNVYSDVPSMGIADAAYANDVRNRQYQGCYAFGQEFSPFFMWHETIATGDAIEYMQNFGSPEDVREAFNVLYPRYGYRSGSALDSFVVFRGAGNIFSLGGAVIGHGFGRYESSKINDVEVAKNDAIVKDSEISNCSLESKQEHDPYPFTGVLNCQDYHWITVLRDSTAFGARFKNWLHAIVKPGQSDAENSNCSLESKPMHDPYLFTGVLNCQDEHPEPKPQPICFGGVCIGR